MRTRRRAVRRWLLVAGAFIVPLVACTVVRPLDYLTDGLADATTASDGAGMSSSDAGNGSGKTWCAVQRPTAYFCADFDEGALTSAYNSGTLIILPAPTVDPGGDASVGTVALSPPGSFTASADPVVDGGETRVRFEQPLAAASAQSAQLEFDLRILSFTAGEEVDFASLYLPNPDGGAPVRAYLSISPSGGGDLDLDQGGPSQGNPFLFPGDGNWHTYRLTIDLVPIATASVYVDDADAAARLTLPGTFATSEQATFFLGITVLGPSTRVEAAFDNVVFTTQ